ncbi:S1 family peptidase [Streptomyces iranensis]|uniref:S1 family peptidase n=1 Tax=Streptomyces iranensis TaxID=576784 RepID=UPI0039B7239B
MGLTRLKEKLRMPKLSLVAAAAALAVVPAVMAPPPAQAIVNGVDSASLRGAVQVYANDNFACGGVLLERRWIITAEHCVENYSASVLKVRLGDRVRGAGSVRKVAEVDEFGVADLALLRLTEDYDGIAPPLAPLGAVPQPYANLALSGWGDTASGGPADRLQVATGRYEGLPEYDGIFHLEGTVLNGAEMANGDSGGPVSGSEGTWAIFTHSDGPSWRAVILTDPRVRNWIGNVTSSDHS